MLHALWKEQIYFGNFFTQLHLFLCNIQSLTQPQTATEWHSISDTVTSCLDAYHGHRHAVYFMFVFGLVLSERTVPAGNKTDNQCFCYYMQPKVVRSQMLRSTKTPLAPRNYACKNDLGLNRGPAADNEVHQHHNARRLQTILKCQRSWQRKTTTKTA